MEKPWMAIQKDNSQGIMGTTPTSQGLDEIYDFEVGCYRTQHFSVVVVHTRTLPFFPHPHCNRTRTRTQTLWKYAVQMST